MSAVNETMNEMKDTVNKAISGTNKGTIAIVLMFIILFIVMYFIYLSVRQRKFNCDLIKSYPMLSIASLSQDILKTPLHKTFIKTAYNCCCNGDLKNGYVDTCALTNCAKQGVRALDFTIYSLHGEAVIGTSTLTSKKYKESYNSLPFTKTMTQVKQMFLYDTANCPNITDPLFLIFRIQSANQKIYNQMGDALQSLFGHGNAAGNKLFKASYTKPMDQEPISSFKGRVIIMVDITGLNGYENSSLAAITGLELGTMTNQIYRETEAFDLLDSGIAPNDFNVNVLYPDFSAKSNNYDYLTVGMKQKFQFIGLNFQMNDVYLSKYNEFFKSAIMKQPDPVVETKK
jgi:hypothetical protein